MKVLVLQALVVLAMLGDVFAIHCFTCNSAKDARCGESFKPFIESIVNCDEQHLEMNQTIPATFCRKIYQIGEKTLDRMFKKLLKQIRLF